MIPSHSDNGTYPNFYQNSIKQHSHVSILWRHRYLWKKKPNFSFIWIAASNAIVFVKIPELETLKWDAFFHLSSIANLHLIENSIWNEKRKLCHENRQFFVLANLLLVFWKKNSELCSMFRTVYINCLLQTVELSLSVISLTQSTCLLLKFSCSILQALCTRRFS